MLACRKYRQCLSLLCHPLRSHDIMFTHRRSIAERGGYFQWRLFVCQFVNMITHERLNVGWWNLAVTCTVQKSRPSSNVKVTRDKKWKPAVHAAADDTNASEPGGDSLTAVHADGGVWKRSSGARSSGPCIQQFYAGGKISTCRLVLSLCPPTFTSSIRLTHLHTALNSLF